MRLALLLLISPLVCLSQTAEERQKIVSSYNREEMAKVKQEAEAYMAEQKALIAAYRAKYNLQESEKHSLQRIHDGVPIFFTTFNDGSSKTIRANSMYPGGSLGLNITGTDITAGVWDGGKTRNTHVELNGRITLGDDATDLSDHATHVTGTVMASGVSATRRGVAYGALGRTYDWNNDYTEMLAFGTSGYLVSNHSYGYDTESLPVWKFGSYDASSIEVDQVSATHPYYQIVIAAGNDRNNTDLEQYFLKGGYDFLSGTGVSKNGITVAAVEQLLLYTDPSSVVMSDFSNFGPPDDGRIKPDIAAKGVGTNSCTAMANATYGVFSGTSMAAPAITGLIVLLQKHYENVNGSFMRAATSRGLICHSAREAGAADGPDYEQGWGLADGLSAANIITNNGISTVLEENTLNNGATFTKQFVVNATQNIRATICWTDPAGSGNISGATDPRAPRLKNNLDLKILKDGNIYYPWKLDPENFFDAATNDTDNDVDNVERIDIFGAEPGIYTIQVTHKGSLQGGTQAYSLIASGTQGLSLDAEEAVYRDNIVLYPNPVKNILNFATPNDAEVTNVAIYDVLGKQVKSGASLMNNAIDLSTLSGGIYVARFTCNGTSFTRKFVKE